MELIKSSSSIMDYDPNPLKHIELVARNCYKSEDKITEESCTPFVKMLKDRKHMAMLEFYPFYFHITHGISMDLLYINNYLEINGDLKIYDNPNQPFTQASCNLRTAIMIDEATGVLTKQIIKQYPELSFLFTRLDNINKDTTLEIDYGVIPDLRYLTGRFICDRGVSHELVRHRMCSFAQESTRYCNYGKDEHIKIIIPSWMNLEEGIYLDGVNEKEMLYDERLNKDNLNDTDECWAYSMIKSTNEYKNALTFGWTPQQARSVLPNSLKTEIIVQARLSEWKHIFEQRCSPKAHPDMQALMIPFKEKVCNISNEYNNYFNS